MTIELYQTPQAGELIKTIKVMGVNPVTLKSLPNPPAVMFSVKLENIKAGDIIDIKSYGQVSNKNKFACMFCWYTVLATSPTNNFGTELTEAKGTNITYEVNHKNWVDVTHFKFDVDFPVIYINTLVYSASQSAVATTQLVVDADYGRSSVMLFRMGV